MAGIKSLAQLRRCDGLVDQGIVTREVFERDLADLDLSALPWRVGPMKDGDPSQEEILEFRDKMVARKAEILAAKTLTVQVQAPVESVNIETTVTREPYNPQGEGEQNGGEGLEAGRPIG